MSTRGLPSSTRPFPPEQEPPQRPEGRRRAYNPQHAPGRRGGAGRSARARRQTWQQRGSSRIPLPLPARSGGGSAMAAAGLGAGAARRGRLPGPGPGPGLLLGLLLLLLGMAVSDGTGRDGAGRGGVPVPRGGRSWAKLGAGWGRVAQSPAVSIAPSLPLLASLPVPALLSLPLSPLCSERGWLRGVSSSWSCSLGTRS